MSLDLGAMVPPTTDSAPEVDTNASETQSKEFWDRLTAIFCDVLFSYANEEAANSVIEESLKLCEGSNELLAKAVQTKFFAKQTPFFMIITNRRDTSDELSSKPRSLVPPLLTKLFEICGDLQEDTQKDILQALLSKPDSDDLYRHVKHKLPLFDLVVPPSFFCGRDEELEAPTLTTSSSAPDVFIATFMIPRFYDKMLVDKLVAFQFMAIGSLWTLKALPVEDEGDGPDSTTLRWCFELSETYTKHNYQKHPPGALVRTAFVALRTDTGLLHSQKFQANCGPVPLTMQLRLSGAMSQFHSNTLVSGKNRVLSGTITVSDALAPPPPPPTLFNKGWPFSGKPKLTG
ncbi:hypothetical protein DFP72DRAFT_1060518 [Ephemerocybe angulata]|uniref:Uncharacterized protein n=1 Tax=Ephemerocybe angulata TaxID=980116 RepID=A0A8H6IF71_9AGAR|nr:hypothetical protein DFP72DRAFT_1060518 [Tulosesus angulatus]